MAILSDFCVKLSTTFYAILRRK